MLLCKKCGKEFLDESQVQLHHIIPKYCGGTDKDERRYLCKKCHDILHNTIPLLIWRHIPLEKRESVKKEIQTWTLRVWLKEAKKDDDTQTITGEQI